MKRTIGIWRKPFKYFSNMSLLRKLTLAYAIAILIPTIIIGYYSYYQSRTFIRNEMANNMRQNLLQMKYNMERRMIIARGMANNIAYNTKILNLLYYGMEFNSESLKDFTDHIAGPVEYALNFNEASIYQIGVYFTNSTIPEYAHFFKEERIRELQWYKDFLKSENDEIWLYPAKSDRFMYNGVSGTTTVFKLVKKIKAVDGKYLGVISMDILEEEMFSSINFNIKGQEIYAINEKNQIIFPQGYNDTLRRLELFNNNVKGENGHFFDGNILYSYEGVEPLNIKIISKTPVDEIIKNSSSPSQWMIFAIVLGVVILEIFTYFILKIIFSRLNQIVKIMNIVARGNFNIRIPVTHKDEVGQLATDFNILIQKINDLINDVIKKETSQKDAQLAALQYQINPHFIYNTIDTFRMKMELEGNYEMADAITYFGKMLRYNISSNSKYATVKEEVDYIEKYITLQRLRYGERLEFSADIPESSYGAKIIRFMLQPIVENSIKHGIRNRDQKLHIQIKLAAKGECMEIQVIDNGSGISLSEVDKLNYQLKYSNYPDRRDSDDGNIGLANINDRIKLFYGEQYYIRIESRTDEYTKTTINIPYISG